MTDTITLQTKNNVFISTESILQIGFFCTEYLTQISDLVSSIARLLLETILNESVVHVFFYQIFAKTGLHWCVYTIYDGHSTLRCQTIAKTV